MSYSWLLYINKEAPNVALQPRQAQAFNLGRKNHLKKHAIEASAASACWTAPMAQVSVGDFLVIGDTWSQHLCDPPDAKPFMLPEVTPIVTTVEVHELVVVIINLLQDGSNYK